MERNSEENWRLRHSKRGRMTKRPKNMKWEDQDEEEYEEDISSISVSGDDLWRCLWIESRRVRAV
jgi:hypothetical protein